METKVEILENILDQCIVRGDAKADWRNGIKTPTTEDKQMATVTYRGVEYDTEEYNAQVVAEAAKRERRDLMYRGLKVKSKATPCS